LHCLYLQEDMASQAAPVFLQLCPGLLTLTAQRAAPVQTECCSFLATLLSMKPPSKRLCVRLGHLSIPSSDGHFCKLVEDPTLTWEVESLSMGLPAISSLAQLGGSGFGRGMRHINLNLAA